MADYAPQYDLFKIINKLAGVGRFIFWVILIFSIAPVIFKTYCEQGHIINTINILNIIGISLFFCIEIINEFILIPQADNRRRDDFVDNSFGSAFAPKNSVGYYDNDHINKGLYKTSVNLFQNCFFTYSLVKATTISKIIVPILMLLTMIVLAFYGFKEVPFALSVLQALFSASILGTLFKHFILLNRLSQIQDTWITLFQNAEFKTDTMKYQAFVFRYWLQYETLQSKINAGISESVFKKNNQPLTTAWEQLKPKYNIS